MALRKSEMRFEVALNMLAAARRKRVLMEQYDFPMQSYQLGGHPDQMSYPPVSQHTRRVIFIDSHW